MNTFPCPHCKGEKSIEMGNQFLEIDGEAFLISNKVKCWTCYGTGEVYLLQLAVYKARGGPAPLPTMTGY